MFRIDLKKSGSMIKTLIKFKEGLLEILFPRICLGCGREGLYICKDCEIFLSEVENTIPGLISVWEYEGLMEKLIQKIKYDGCYHIIDELAEKALEKADINLPADTYITYVPMYPKKERERGFNQSELIAKRMGKIVGLPVVRFLEKIKDNRSQVGLSPKEREENVNGVFCLTPGIKQNCLTPGVVLVDDFYTTGATAKECIRVLKGAGVKNVWVFTLAHKLNL